MAPVASAATVLVDDDGVQCPNAGSRTSVAAGIADAGSGGTVIVCPGTYREAALRIPYDLTVKGAGASRVRIGPQSPGTAPVLTAAAGTVNISGVTVAASGTATGGGIHFSGATGSVTNVRVSGMASSSGPAVLASGGAFELGGSLVEGYASTGVRLQSAGANVHDSAIFGPGSSTNAAADTDGIEVSTAATATIARNLIADNRNRTGAQDGSGIRFAGDGSGSSVQDNDIQGNGFGVLIENSTGACDDGTVPAYADARNWWGNGGGPSRSSCAGSPTVALGDPINLLAPVAAFEPTPHGAPAAPGSQADGPPVLENVAPADGTEVAPGSAVAVSVTARDDFDVKRVEFRSGSQVTQGARSADGSYSASLTAPGAGESRAVVITAFDSSDQTSVAAFSLRGTPTPAQQQPQSPAEDDRPPSVAITGPASGSSINPGASPKVSADASDDRGVARVGFLDDGKVVCVDDTAPYECAYAPTGDDVGRNTLIAIAVDGSGQTAADFRSVSVGRFTPKLTAKTTPGRDRKRPYRYATSGALKLPAGVTPAQACTSGSLVDIVFTAGKLKLPTVATLKSDCTYKTSIAFPSRRPLGRGRLSVKTTFPGNPVVGAAKAKAQKVRAG